MDIIRLAQLCSKQWKDYGVTKAGGGGNQGTLFVIDRQRTCIINSMILVPAMLLYTGKQADLGLNGKLYGATLAGGIYYDEAFLNSILRQEVCKCSYTSLHPGTV